MSKSVSPAAIGGFTLGALVLLVVGLLTFGGTQLLNTNKAYFVIFFESSLNGLEVGAPVKMQGVKIGTVTQVVLQTDPESGKVYKPVVVEIDRNSFVGKGGARVFDGSPTREEQKEMTDRLAAEGFRARLEMQSLLTGLLYVDFDMHPSKPAIYTGLDYQDLIELPCIPATSDELRNTAEEMAEKLRSLPLDQIVQDLGKTLREIRDLLGSDDVKNSRVALAGTLQEMEKAVTTLNRNLDPLLKDTRNAIGNANALVRDSRALVHDARLEVKPVLASAQQTLTAATAALNRAGSAVAAVEGSVGPESSLHETLVALKDAARSIRDLTDYLERHPESLLSGKEN